MTLSCFFKTKKNETLPITVVPVEKFGDWLKGQDTYLHNYLATRCFKAKSGNLIEFSDEKGVFSGAFLCIDAEDMWALAGIDKKLPALDYYLEDPFSVISACHYLGFGLEDYVFKHYKTKHAEAKVKLHLPASCQAVEKALQAIYLVRDMINTPAEDMGPLEISQQVERLAETFSAEFHEVVGEDLIEAGYPGVYAVGRASSRLPRVVQLDWGDRHHPHIVLVGKGVAFDTGGLDIKPAASMRLMHKDMGGAANVLGLAQLVMAMQLPVRLTVMIPAVDNAVSENAYRPSDVIKMANGTTVEITNTDAEGRVILADVLHKASHLNPSLLLDFATLTGAARVAVGTEMAAFFTNNKSLAEALDVAAEKTQDPLWQMPLFKPYRKLLDSKVADMKNAALVPFAGSITAALFLEHFVKKGTEWAHFDLMAWNVNSLPGRPEGGDAMGLRAVYHMLEKRYG